MPRSNAAVFGIGQNGVNIAAALDAIAVSEIGATILANSDDGYNVIVGSVATAVATFNDYSKHPNVRVWLPKINDWSTAAGRYQVLNKYGVAYIQQLSLPDFGPESQDKIAVQMIRECKAIPLFMSGRFDDAITACRSRWASLPGAGYGQHENSMDALRSAWQAAGGVLA